MIKSMASPSELWHIRKEMTLQMASFVFMTYVMSMGARFPSRIHISRSTGKIFTSDMIPCTSSCSRRAEQANAPFLTMFPIAAITPNKPEFTNNEAVPFRFTPNFQRFITPIGTEGLLTSSMMAIARCLTESEVRDSRSFAVSPVSLPTLTFSPRACQFDLEHRLSIFVREEVLTWSQMLKNDPRHNLREIVLSNVDAVVRRAKVMSCKMEREKVRFPLSFLFGFFRREADAWVLPLGFSPPQPPSASIPVNQSILELLLQATSVHNLSKMEPTVRRISCEPSNVKLMVVSLSLSPLTVRAVALILFLLQVYEPLTSVLYPLPSCSFRDRARDIPVSGELDRDESGHLREGGQALGRLSGQGPQVAHRARVFPHRRLNKLGHP
jgi:transformation/transcription domain-associated protein